jgi:Family of unknown function (DUF6335)
MAKRTAARGKKTLRRGGKKAATRRPAKRPRARRPLKRQASAKKKAPSRKASKKAQPKAVAPKRTTTRPKPKAPSESKSSAPPPGKVPRLDRARRTLDDDETLRTPPSSLNMNRQGSAVRTGRAEAAQNIREHHGMNSVTGGDPDVDIEDAYFTGEEAPGGDNSTPDQDVVDDIGKALGVTYNDNEELKGAGKLEERDRHRWELDPASAEDFTEHDKE